MPSGENVSPELVELALSQAHYVKELLVIPNHQNDSFGIGKEVIKVIVRPDWDEIETTTNLSPSALMNRPQVLKNLLWQSINECQQENQELSPFEKIPSKELLEVKLDDFEKTPTGKIKREVYVK